MSTPAQRRSAESTGRDDPPRPEVTACFERARATGRHWADVPLKQRLTFLGKLRHLVAGHVDDLTAPLDATHVRAPGESLAAEVLPLAEACRFLQKRAAGILKPRRHRTRMLPLWLAGLDVEVRREPLGVVLVVGPSNYPLFLTGVQLVQALAAGNAVVVKPGRTGGEVLQVLARLLGRAGVPDGLVHVLDESTEAGHAAVAAGPDKVVLTGGLDTGRAVLGELAETMTPAVMELSGCDAVLVHPRSDLQLVARCMAFGMRLNGGATCIGPHRLFATADTLDQLVDPLVRAIGALEAMPVDRPVAERARGLIDRATAAGATVLCGRVTDDSRIAPVVLRGVRPEMDVARSDVFAPVLGLIEVGSMEEVFELDEACPFALGAALFGPDDATAEWARRIDAGSITVGDIIAPTAHPEAPFGGRRLSGFGVTRGAEGLLAMTRVKTIVTRRAAMRPHLDPPDPHIEEAMKNYLAAAHGPGLWRRFKHMVRAVKLFAGSAPEETNKR